MNIFEVQVGDVVKVKSLHESDRHILLEIGDIGVIKCIYLDFRTVDVMFLSDRINKNTSYSISRHWCMCDWQIELVDTGNAPKEVLDVLSI